MATQYTNILKLALPTTGELSGTWGEVVNDNITSMVEEAIAGLATINTWTTNSHTLTSANGTTAESRAAVLELTDTGAALTGAATVICPTATKIYLVKNSTGQTATIKTSAGTGIAVPNGATMLVYCDGTNVVEGLTNISSATINGYTITLGGNLTTAGAFTTSGANPLTLTTTGSTNVTLPTTGTLATLAGTETLSNKTLASPTVTGTLTGGNVSAVDLSSSGNTVLGNADTDTVTFNADVASHLIPSADDTYDLGAVGSEWRNLYIDGTANIDALNADSLVATTADINGGTIDGATINSSSIGQTTPAAGAFTTLTASTSLNINSSTTVNGVIDDDTMATASATTLSTSESVKAYVDAQVSGVDTLSEVLTNGNTTGGTDISVSTGDDITFADSSKAIFGAGSDLQIYHDGSNSYVDEQGTGNLIIRGTQMQLKASDGTSYAEFNDSGAVNLRYSGDLKLATTSTGVDVTGTITATVGGEVDFTTDNDGSFDLGAGQNFSCTPTANFTLTFTNIPNGKSGFILLVNTGGHTVSLHANSKADANFASTVSTAGTYVVSYIANGTNVYLTTSGAIA